MMNPKHSSMALCLVFTFSLFATNPVAGTSVVKRNLVDLVKIAERIVIGEVINLTDGIDPGTGAPYTEITLQVSQAIKGLSKTGSFSFKQFGLLRPRLTTDGRHMNLMVTPPGFPRYNLGEEVMLFLCREGAITGFCTTVGLVQGKFIIENSKILSGVSNQDLFEGISTSELSLSDEEKKILLTKRGPVSSDLFISLVKKMARVY